MLEFDEFGFLKPYDVIKISKEELSNNFVWNQKRTSLYQEFLHFLGEISKLQLKDTYFWINGSFVTKKEDPNDIDIVVFIGAEQNEKFQKELRNLRNEFKLLDLYFVRIYPENHPLRYIYEMDKDEWIFQFSFTRKNIKTGRRYPKGFLELKP
ncbi:MAG: DUF6932 family protein [Spirosomataceae bacterium]